MALTVQSIIDSAALLKAAPAMPRIVFTYTALAETTERLFPTSRNRSRRIHKKLVKRHGGEFRKQPAMWQVGDTIYAHPSFEARIKAQFKEKQAVDLESAIFGGVAPWGGLLVTHRGP